MTKRTIIVGRDLLLSYAIGGTPVRGTGVLGDVWVRCRVRGSPLARGGDEQPVCVPVTPTPWSKY